MLKHLMEWSLRCGLVVVHFHFFWMSWDAVDLKAIYSTACLSITVAPAMKMLVCNAYAKVNFVIASLA